jgi:hypothetical protein
LVILIRLQVEIELPETFPQWLKRLRKKAWFLGERPEEHTAGAKALIDLIAFTARLKSCPFKTAFQ